MTTEQPSFETVLVTGGSGFIGSHLIDELLRRGCRVVVVARGGVFPEPVEVVIDDGTLEDLVAAVRRVEPDVCFHLATHLVASHGIDDIEPMVEANLRFGIRICEALSHLSDVVMVNVGTVWQHYDSARYSPVSLYAAMKQAFQDIVQFYAEMTSLRTVTIELVDSYGPGDRRKKLVSLLMDAAVSGDSLAMSGGEQIFDVLHVDDVVKGLIEAPAHASSASPIFALRQHHPPTVRQFVAQVEEVLGVVLMTDWGARPYRQREMMSQWNVTPILPGWEPTIALSEGLRTVWGAS